MDNLLQDAYAVLQEEVNSFEIEHKTCKFSVRGAVPSGVTGGEGGRGQSAPQRLPTRKFLLTYWEKRGKEKREKEWVKIRSPKICRESNVSRHSCVITRDSQYFFFFREEL